MWAPCDRVSFSYSLTVLHCRAWITKCPETRFILGHHYKDVLNYPGAYIRKRRSHKKVVASASMDYLSYLPGFPSLSLSFSKLSLSLSLFKLQKSQSTPDVSSSFEPPAEFSPIEHEFEDPLAQVAKETKKQQPFTTCVDVRNSLEHLRQALEQDETCDQYLVFTSVPRCNISD